jgi:hypothetical protein
VAVVARSSICVCSLWGGRGAEFGVYIYVCAIVPLCVPVNVCVWTCAGVCVRVHTCEYLHA